PAPTVTAQPMSGQELRGLRAMVTGSSSGIGRAIAMEFAAAGADILIHARHSQEAANAVAANVTSRGVRSKVPIADLADPAACELLVRSAWESWGGIEVWVNNAGADTLTGEAARWPFEQKLATLLDVDVRGTILLSRAAGQRMKSAGGGVLLNMGWDQA